MTPPDKPLLPEMDLAEHLAIRLYAEQHDMTFEEVQEELASDDGIGDVDYFHAWETGIKYALDHTRTTPEPAASVMPETLREANRLGNREHFADTKDGLAACIAYGEMLTDLMCRATPATQPAGGDALKEAIEEVRLGIMNSQDGWKTGQIARGYLSIRHKPVELLLNHALSSGQSAAVVPEWQPIKSNWIDNEDGTQSSAPYDFEKYDRFLLSVKDIRDGKDYTIISDRSEFFEFLLSVHHEPTHWMPLPAAPNESGG